MWTDRSGCSGRSGSCPGSRPSSPRGTGSWRPAPVALSRPGRRGIPAPGRGPGRSTRYAALLSSSSCRDQLPLLVGAAGGGPLRDRGAVDDGVVVHVGHQSALVACDGVVPVARWPQVPLLVRAAGGGPLLQLHSGRRGVPVDVEQLAGGGVAQGVGTVLAGAEGPGRVS